MLEFLREVREENGGGGGGESWGQVAENTVKPLLSILERKMTLDEQRSARRAGVPAPAQASASAAQLPPAPAAGPVVTDVLEALLLTVPVPARKFLAECAERDSDPEAYVAMVLDNLSDEAYAVLGEQVQRDDFLAVLFRVVPRFGQHPQWFAQFRDALQAELAAADTEGDETEGQAAPAPQGTEAVVAAPVV